MSARSGLDAPLDSERAAHYRDVFHRFARVESPDLASPMYAELAYGISLDHELLELAAQKRRRQPAPNMLFAAVQYLLLSRGAYADHPLAAHYPIVSGGERPMEPAFPAFRDFCLSHRDEIVELISTHRTQTNVVRRCTCLLPVFSMIQRESGLPLALIDVGASAGLNLNVDRYRYRYLRGGQEEATWGHAEARVELEAELRGGGAMPPLAADLSVWFRGGIDINPIDLTNDDELRWLRALIWPEHVERHQRLIDGAHELAQVACRPPCGRRGRVTAPDDRRRPRRRGADGLLDRGAVPDTDSRTRADLRDARRNQQGPPGLVGHAGGVSRRHRRCAAAAAGDHPIHRW